MQFLITGVNSIIGVNLCNYLLKKNHSVIGIYNKNNNNLKLINKKCKLIKLNLLRFNKKKLPNQIDIAVHIAASTNNKGQNLFKINYNGSKKLFDYSISCNAKLFIFFSTVSIDLDNKNIQKKKYVISKEKAEIYFKNRSNIKVISLRIPAILSPEPNKNLWIYNILKKIELNKKVEIYNPYSYSNHFIYYTDIVKFINKLSTFSYLKTFDKINLCSRGKIRIIDIIKMIIKKTKSTSQIKFIKSNKKNILINQKKLEKIYFFKSLKCKTVIKKFIIENIKKLN